MRRGTLAAGLVLAATALLAGCTVATPAAQTPTRTPTPTPTTPCIVGTWTTGADQLQPAYNAIPAGLDYPQATIDPKASATIALASDGTFTFTQDVPASLTWFEHPAAVRLGGTMAGTYEATDAALSLKADDNQLTVEPTDSRLASKLFAAATQETLAEWPVAATSFECNADTLTLDLETEGHFASVEFTRQ